MTKHMLRTGQRLYERPGRPHRRLEAQALIASCDVQPLLEQMQRGFIHRLIREVA